MPTAIRLFAFWAFLTTTSLTPASAIHPNVGANIDDFTVLGRNVSVSATGTALINGNGVGASVAGSPGRTGATMSIVGGTVTSNPGGNVVGGIAPTAVTEVGALQSGLAALTPSFTFPGTVDLRTLDIDGGGPIPPGTLIPAVYSFVNVNISDSGASPDVTFSGSGEYIINVSGSFTTADNVQTALAGGANAADIFWNVANLVSVGDINMLTGLLLAGTSALIGDGTTVQGKLMTSIGDTSMLDNGVAPRPTINDAGFPPNVFVNGASVPQAGAQLEVCTGETLAYTVSATDPEGQLTTLSRTSIQPATAAPGFTSPASSMGTPTATLNEMFDSSLVPPALVGTTVTSSYRASDASGAVTDFEVDIAITAALSTISGVVFNDLNNNGMFDPPDVGIPGVTVELDFGPDNTPDATTTTNGSGQYEFTDLAPGTYRVRIVVPISFSQTTPDPPDVVAQGCSDTTGVNFGLRRAPSNAAPALGPLGLVALSLALFAIGLRRAFRRQ